MTMDQAESRPPPAALEEIREVVGRAKRGDPAAVPRLRELLDQHPALWRAAGDLGAQVERAWVALAAGPDLHLRESALRYVAKLRAELARPGAGPVERLMVEQAANTWLQMHYFSGVEANAHAADESPRLAQYRAKRLAQAQRAHERALAALAVYRKLIPADEVRPAVSVAVIAAAEQPAEDHAVDARTALPWSADEAADGPDREPARVRASY